MMAYDMFCNTRESYRLEEKEKREKKKEKGVNPWKAMRDTMGL